MLFKSQAHWLLVWTGNWRPDNSFKQFKSCSDFLSTQCIFMHLENHFPAVSTCIMLTQSHQLRTAKQVSPFPTLLPITLKIHCFVSKNIMCLEQGITADSKHCPKMSSFQLKQIRSNICHRWSYKEVLNPAQTANRRQWMPSARVAPIITHQNGCHWRHLAQPFEGLKGRIHCYYLIISVSFSYLKGSENESEAMESVVHVMQAINGVIWLESKASD